MYSSDKYSYLGDSSSLILCCASLPKNNTGVYHLKAI